MIARKLACVPPLRGGIVPESYDYPIVFIEQSNARAEIRHYNVAVAEEIKIAR